jgi:hypothetical protein
MTRWRHAFEGNRGSGAVEEPGRTVEEPGRTVEEPGRTVEEPGRTVEEPGRTSVGDADLG